MALTQDGDDNLCLHGSRAHAVARLAAVPRVVVVGGRDEVVHVAALPTAGCEIVAPKFELVLRVEKLAGN